MRSRTVLIAILSSLLLVIVFSGGCSYSEEKDTTPPAERESNLIIAVPPWMTGIIPSYIAKQVLEQRLDFTVDLNEENNLEVIYQELARGDIDLYMDAWLPDLDKPYMDEYGENIDDLAVSYQGADIGFVVPAYLEDVNSINDLKSGDLFDSDGDGKGEFYGIDQNTDIMQKAVATLETYELDYEIVELSEDQLISRAEQAYSAGEAILFIGWRPHWIFFQQDLKFLADPEGLWQSSRVHIVSHKGFQNYAPDAHNFLKHWALPIEDLEEMLYQYQKQGMNPDEIAQQWIAANGDKVDQWLDPR